MTSDNDLVRSEWIAFPLQIRVRRKNMLLTPLYDQILPKNGKTEEIGTIIQNMTKREFSSPVQYVRIG